MYGVPLMRIFSVPADFRAATIDRYCELNERYDSARVDETYGQATVGVLFGSGRSSNELPAVDLNALEKYVAYSASRNIDFNYTFNASCLGNREFTEAGIRQINRFIGRLWNMGIRNLTIALPQLMMLVADSKYPFTVKASTLCLVNSASKAAFHKNHGIKRIVIDEDITRDFKTIRQICEAFGDGVEMIANSRCIVNCPLKMLHYNHESHFRFGRQDIKGFYDRSCALNRLSDWTSPIRLNWVRPEDIGLYESVGVHRFKIQGREIAFRGDPVKTTEAYMSGSYTGNLFDLLSMFDPRAKTEAYQLCVENRALDGFIARFYDHPDACTGDCGKCGYCAAFAKASMDREKTEAMNDMLRSSLGEKDPFESYMEKPVVARMGHRLARRVFSAIHKKA